MCFRRFEDNNFFKKCVQGVNLFCSTKWKRCLKVAATLANVGEHFILPHRNISGESYFCIVQSKGQYCNTENYPRRKAIGGDINQYIRHYNLYINPDAQCCGGQEPPAEAYIFPLLSPESIPLFGYISFLCTPILLLNSPPNVDFPSRRALQTTAHRIPSQSHTNFPKR